MKRYPIGIQSFETSYDIENTLDSPGIRFKNVLEAVYKETGKKVVVLIDEYGKPLLDSIGTEHDIYNPFSLLNAFDKKHMDNSSKSRTVAEWIVAE